MKRTKQFLSLFLAFAILFTMLPTAGFAVETEPTEDTAIEEYTDILNEETISEAQMDTAEEEIITDEQIPEQTEETTAPEEVIVQTDQEETVVSE